MKLVLIADVSVNGKLLLTDNPRHPIPQVTFDFYAQKVNQAGNVIVGRKTVESLQQHFGDIQQIFPGVVVVVVSTMPRSASGYTVVGSPEEAVTYLQQKGFNELMIGGGTQVYNAFLNRHLVTDVYFNYVPVIVGDGGLLGTDGNLLTHFDLLDHKQLGNNIMQLHLSRTASDVEETKKVEILAEPYA